MMDRRLELGQSFGGGLAVQGGGELCWQQGAVILGEAWEPVPDRNPSEMGLRVQDARDSSLKVENENKTPI